MILKVFPKVGDRLSVAESYDRLLSLWVGDPYCKNKAAGSLGGAVHGGTIVLKEGYYERVR